MSAAVRHFARRKGRLFLDGVHEGFRWQLIWPMLAIGVGTAVLGYGWAVAGIASLAFVVGEGRGRKQGRKDTLAEVTAQQLAARDAAAARRLDAERRLEHLRQFHSYRGPASHIVDVDSVDEP